MTRRLLLPTITLLALAHAALAVDTARIDASGGAPRLMLDGKPARCRIFFGIPGTRPLSIETEPRVISFEFTPTQQEPGGGTLHLRFGQTPGDVWLDDVSIVDLTTGRPACPTADFEGGEASFSRAWRFWPTGPANTVGSVSVRPGEGRGGSAALRIRLQAPPNGQWPDFHIFTTPNLALDKSHRYRVSFWCKATNKRDAAAAIYRPGNPFVLLGGPPNVFPLQIKMAANVGVDIVSFPVDLPWPEPGKPEDWSTPEAQCREVLEANPKALLLPRLWAGPPAWWIQAHPGAAMKWDRPAPDQQGVVVASPEYRRDAAARLSALVRHLESKFGPHMIGYHPCGQNTGEWFYHETWGLPLSGYAEDDLRGWRTWLAGRYGDDAALRRWWGDPAASLSRVAVPTPAARLAAPAGVLRDPVKERSLIDFNQYRQDAMADCVCTLARAVRQATGGNKLVVFFYGYVFEFGAIVNDPSTAGHYALRRVLNSPDIDVLCSPISYFDRGLGHSAPAMTAAESVALAGKMWLYEDDTRTYLATGHFPGEYDGVDTLEKTNQELLRNTAQCAVRNFGTWWMDLGASGWFNDPRMWAEMKRLEALDLPLLERPTAFRPEVAAVIDEASMVRVAQGGRSVTLPGVYEVRRPLGRMGAPYGQYLLDDVLAGKVHAKLYVMLNTWRLSPAERRQLLTATRGAVRLWCYAPGYHDHRGTTLDGMRELTGFAMKRLSLPQPTATPTSRGRQLGLHDAFGGAVRVEPLFAAADATAEETLAAYSDGSAAVAMRRTADGQSLFVGAPGLTSQLLRLAAREAKVHLYSSVDCNVYANGPYVILHAARDGVIPLDVGRTTPVRDLLTGQTVGQGPKLSLPMQFGQTRVLVAAPR